MIVEHDLKSHKDIINAGFEKGYTGTGWKPSWLVDTVALAAWAKGPHGGPLKGLYPFVLWAPWPEDWEECPACHFCGPHAGAGDLEDGHCCGCQKHQAYAGGMSVYDFTHDEDCQFYALEGDDSEDEDEEESMNDEPRGASAKPPWVVRGDDIPRIDHTRPERELSRITSELDAALRFGLDPRELDPVQAMGEYYLLEMISSGAGLPAGMAHEFDVEFAILEAKKAMHSLVKTWDKPLQNYVDMACGGELRHHNCFRGYSEQGTWLPSARCHAWIEWMEIRKHLGPQALLDGAELFEEFTDGGFGGPLWAEGCRALYGRLTGTYSAQMFLDRVWNLQHNGGCFLNKLHWKRDNEPNWGVEQMVLLIGPAHAASPPIFGPLMAVAREEIRKIVREYFKGIRIVAMDWRRPEIRSQLEELNLWETPTPCSGADKEGRNATWRLRAPRPKGGTMAVSTTWHRCPYLPVPVQPELPEGYAITEGSAHELMTQAVELWNDDKPAEAVRYLASALLKGKCLDEIEGSQTWKAIEHFKPVEEQARIQGDTFLQRLNQVFNDLCVYQEHLRPGEYIMVRDASRVYRAYQKQWAELHMTHEEAVAKGLVKAEILTCERHDWKYYETDACTRCAREAREAERATPKDPSQEILAAVNASRYVVTKNTVHGAVYISSGSTTEWIQTVEDQGDETPGTGKIPDYAGA